MNKKRLLFIVNTDWFFLSHRLPIALEAIKRGYEVHIATTITKELHFFYGDLVVRDQFLKFGHLRRVIRVTALRATHLKHNVIFFGIIATHDSR